MTLVPRAGVSWVNIYVVYGNMCFCVSDTQSTVFFIFVFYFSFSVLRNVICICCIGCHCNRWFVVFSSSSLHCPVHFPVQSRPVPSRPVPSRPVPSRPSRPDQSRLVSSRPVPFHPVPFYRVSSRPVPSCPLPSLPCPFRESDPLRVDSRSAEAH